MVIIRVAMSPHLSANNSPRERAPKIYLTPEQPKTKAELQGELQSSHANISRVLRHLRHAGFVVSSVTGKQAGDRIYAFR